MLFLLSISILVGFSTPILWQKVLKPYQRERILGFVYPEKYRHGSAWQTRQAKIALGSGGIFGKGYKKGTQKGLAFLPAAHTDFIFASIGEEFGFAGCFAIILGFFSLITAVLRRSQRVKEKGNRLLAQGIALSLAFSVLVNLGSNLGIFPVGGMPLPFISYGGSHLFFEFVSLGMVLSILREESTHSTFLRY